MTPDTWKRAAKHHRAEQRALYRMLTLVTDERNAAQAEVRRLREENETLMLDALAADAIRRYERGETQSLRDYAAERGIDVPPAGRAQEGD